MEAAGSSPASPTILKKTSDGLFYEIIKTCHAFRSNEFGVDRFSVRVIRLKGELSFYRRDDGHSVSLTFCLSRMRKVRRYKVSIDQFELVVAAATKAQLLKS